MPFPMYPGVFVYELEGPRIITPVGTSVAGFVGAAPDVKAHIGEAVPVNNWSQFCAEFAAGDSPRATYLAHAVYGFFLNGGSRCFVVNLSDDEALQGAERPRTGLKLLEEIDEIAIVAAPGRSDPASYESLLAHCELNGDRVCICDPPNITDMELLKVVATVPLPSAVVGPQKEPAAAEAKGARPRNSGYAALYAPWIVVKSPFDVRGKEPPVPVPPSGHMAGVWARTDATRGVHKAPANTPLMGALSVTYRVTNAEQGDLNSHGINCIRYFTGQGIRPWGVKTLADSSADDTYVNVRRTMIMIKESIKRSNSWAVFEPNDRTLWKTLRSEVTGFLRTVYADGALVGATAEDAFFVKCDEETNPIELIRLGQVNTVIGLAPVTPAEFIIFKIGLSPGGLEAKTV